MKKREIFQKTLRLSKKWIIVFISIFFIDGIELSAQVKINEFLADNYSGLEDPSYKKRVDWIELYNNGGNAINLTGLYLTDDISDLDRWPFPPGTVINPHQFLLIWADNENNGIHTNFGLNSSGEFIAIVTATGIILDSVSFGPQSPDISAGRMPDGTGPWFLFKKPTPGSANSSSTDGIMALLPEFSHTRGRYESSFFLRLSSGTKESVIRFSLDGSDPGPNSSKFIDPIEISGPVVVKARLFVDGLLPSPVATQTYLVNETSRLPVFSISTAPENLWDQDTGIYTEGRNYVWGWGNGNFWQDWEKECFAEFFETDGIAHIATTAGLKIAGGLTRTASQKSLELIARGRYGEAKFNYRFFRDKMISSFNEIKLRNAGNDWAATMMADGMMQTVVAGQMDIDYQAYRPAILFLNGQYWGIHNMREMLSSDYVEENHGFDKSSIDLLAYIGAVRQGDSKEYDELMSFVKSHDLGVSDFYQEVAKRIDIEEYINYNVAQVYFGNHDWPAGNIKYWRPRIDQGLWRWILFDLDLAFANPGLLTLEWATLENPPFEGSTDLLRGLFKNPDFKAQFLRVFQKHLNTTFRPERVVGIIDSIQNNISAEMPRHINRWKGWHGWTFIDPVAGYIETPWLADYDEWLSNVEKLRNFARKRHPFLITHIKDFFNLDNPVLITFRIDPPGSGRIWVDQALVVADELPATYFSNQDIELRAIPGQRFRFEGWEINGFELPEGQELIPELTRRFDKNAIVTARFRFTSVIPELSINEVMARNADFYPDKYGMFSDWIEIYNPGDREMELAGLYFTDNHLNPGKWEIPSDDPSLTTVGPRSYLIFYADEKPSLGSNHLGFKMDGDGEFIGLSLKKSTGYIWIDSLQIPEVVFNRSVGRFPDGHSEIVVFTKKPTPGYANVRDEADPEQDDIVMNLPFPVPFSDRLTLSFDLLKEYPVTIRVRNIQGDIIRLITSRIYQAGKYREEWNGRDSAGHKQPPGVYLITLDAPYFSETVKTLLIY